MPASRRESNSAPARTKPRTPAPQWLTERERAAWVPLLGVLQYLPAALDANLRHGHGLTLTEYYALAMLSDAPGRRLQTKKLAVFTNTSLARLSRVLSGLEADGFVRRLPNASDRRATDIELTREGFAKLEQAAPDHVAEVRRLVFDPQHERGVDELRAIVTGILDALDPGQVLPRDPLELRAAAAPPTTPADSE